MNGLIGRKIGMTSVFDSEGKNLCCTVIDVSPNKVTQVKTADTDGYEALQLAFGEAKEKNTSGALMGHLKKAGSTAKRKIVEFRDFDLLAKSLGDELKVDEVFEEGEKVNVIGTSKGKGFQGVVKRYNFKGVGDATHGQHNRLRAPGSLGAGSTPSKVIKGMRMGGRMGGDRVKTKNLTVIKIFAEQNLLLVKGAVPGHKGSFVIIEK